MVFKKSLRIQHELMDILLLDSAARICFVQLSGTTSTQYCPSLLMLRCQRPHFHQGTIVYMILGLAPPPLTPCISAARLACLHTTFDAWTMAGTNVNFYKATTNRASSSLGGRLIAVHCVVCDCWVKSCWTRRPHRCISLMYIVTPCTCMAPPCCFIHAPAHSQGNHTVKVAVRESEHACLVSERSSHETQLSTTTIDWRNNKADEVLSFRYHTSGSSTATTSTYTSHTSFREFRTPQEMLYVTNGATITTQPITNHAAPAGNGSHDQHFEERCWRDSHLGPSQPSQCTDKHCTDGHGKHSCGHA